jgi:quercetin dioxygenase-like cupin family protein
MMIRTWVTIVAFAVALLAGQSMALAQTPPPITRTPLQTFDVPGTNHQTVIGIAQIAPNVNIGRHTHPGPESGYLLEGELVLMVQGQPDKTVKTGESYVVPAGAVHDAKTGPQGAKVLATYVVEKGKPLASPAQ